MNKLLHSTKFFFKVVGLLLIILFAWAYINLSNLLKQTLGSEKEKERGTGGLLGPEEASADIPFVGGCPHIAIYDGTRFSVENDVLPGDFKGIASPRLAKLLGTFKLAGPDALIVSRTPQMQNGRLVLRLEENEEEESFIRSLALERVLHPRGSKVVIESGTKEPWIFDAVELKRNIMLPLSVIKNGRENMTARFQSKDRIFEISDERNGLDERGDRLEFDFKLNGTGECFLLLNAVYRDWMAGDAPELTAEHMAREIGRSPFALRAGVSLGAILLSAFLGERAQALAAVPHILPHIMGGGGGGEGAGGSAGEAGKSIFFSYRAPNGAYRPLAIHKPRSWRYSTEMIRLPQDAVRKDGRVTLIADFSKTHTLGFIGLLQGARRIPIKIENLSPTEARHSRTGDVTGKLLAKKEVHLIPGDRLEILFQEPSIALGTKEKETYLVRSEGFYMGLRKETKDLAGDWKKRLSPEARRHLYRLRELAA